ncbi:unnamed protein product [Vitrella brassicaformis CCMP3155]|uniref:EF-hand domain-containing protein n=3 Tax=Vitrella brassicaformis TaxID=1169539 RepID=A0A0G4GA26_VITBC|nr:unnamed protein product [Vitrella brassicaformis CCMP3155]|eukprot:CEM25800.1 unnamed protein product [Vitrella brassicaformis CCMP3155]
MGNSGSAFPLGPQVLQPREPTPATSPITNLALDAICSFSLALIQLCHMRYCNLRLFQQVLNLALRPGSSGKHDSSVSPRKAAGSEWRPLFSLFATPDGRRGSGASPRSLQTSPRDAPQSSPHREPNMVDTWEVFLTSCLLSKTHRKAKFRLLFDFFDAAKRAEGEDEHGQGGEGLWPTSGELTFEEIQCLIQCCLRGVSRYCGVPQPSPWEAQLCASDAFNAMLSSRTHGGTVSLGDFETWAEDDPDIRAFLKVHCPMTPRHDQYVLLRHWPALLQDPSLMRHKPHAPAMVALHSPLPPRTAAGPTCRSVPATPTGREGDPLQLFQHRQRRSDRSVRPVSVLGIHGEQREQDDPQDQQQSRQPSLFLTSVPEALSRGVQDEGSNEEEASRMRDAQSVYLRLKSWTPRTSTAGKKETQTQTQSRPSSSSSSVGVDFDVGGAWVSRPVTATTMAPSPHGMRLLSESSLSMTYSGSSASCAPSSPSPSPSLPLPPSQRPSTAPHPSEGAAPHRKRKLRVKVDEHEISAGEETKAESVATASLSPRSSDLIGHVARKTYDADDQGQQQQQEGGAERRRCSSSLRDVSRALEAATDRPWFDNLQRYLKRHVHALGVDPAAGQFERPPSTYHRFGVFTKCGTYLGADPLAKRPQPKKAAVDTLYAYECFCAMDVDKDGVIGMDELVRALATHETRGRRPGDIGRRVDSDQVAFIFASDALAEELQDNRFTFSSYLRCLCPSATKKEIDEMLHWVRQAQANSAWTTIRKKIQQRKNLPDSLRRFYLHLFHLIDTDQDGLITGEDVIDFFLRPSASLPTGRASSTCPVHHPSPPQSPRHKPMLTRKNSHLRQLLMRQAIDRQEDQADAKAPTTERKTDKGKTMKGKQPVAAAKDKEAVKVISGGVAKKSAAAPRRAFRGKVVGPHTVQTGKMDDIDDETQKEAVKPTCAAMPTGRTREKGEETAAVSQPPPQKPQPRPIAPPPLHSLEHLAHFDKFTHPRRHYAHTFLMPVSSTSPSTTDDDEDDRSSSGDSDREHQQQQAHVDDAAMERIIREEALKERVKRREASRLTRERMRADKTSRRIRKGTLDQRLKRRMRYWQYYAGEPRESLRLTTGNTTLFQDDESHEPLFPPSLPSPRRTTPAPLAIQQTSAPSRPHTACLFMQRQTDQRWSRLKSAKAQQPQPQQQQDHHHHHHEGLVDEMGDHQKGLRWSVRYGEPQRSEAPMRYDYTYYETWLRQNEHIARCRCCPPCYQVTKSPNGEWAGPRKYQTIGRLYWQDLLIDIFLHSRLARSLEWERREDISSTYTDQVAAAEAEKNGGRRPPDPRPTKHEADRLMADVQSVAEETQQQASQRDKPTMGEILRSRLQHNILRRYLDKQAWVRLMCPDEYRLPEESKGQSILSLGVVLRRWQEATSKGTDKLLPDQRVKPANLRMVRSKVAEAVKKTTRP